MWQQRASEQENVTPLILPSAHVPMFSGTAAQLSCQLSVSIDRHVTEMPRNTLKWPYLPALVRSPAVRVVFSDVRINPVEGELFIRSHRNCLYD